MRPSVVVSLVFYGILNFFFKQSECSTINRRSERSDIDWSNSFAINEGANYILGGFYTHIENYPWIVSLNYDNSHHCGGSIISPTRILTAAHCTIDRISSRLKILAGSSGLHENPTVVGVSKIVNHPRYNKFTAENDISILYLASALKMSLQIGVINLPEDDQIIPEGKNLQVAGWGATNLDGHSTEYLMVITIPAVQHARCANLYQWLSAVTDSMICAGFDAGNQSPCYGDSGGPLTYGRTLVGIVSWGDRCGGKPTVFTRAASFTKWIKRHL